MDNELDLKQGTTNKKRISVINGSMMMVVAAGVDMLQWGVGLLVFGVVTASLALVANWLIGAIAWLIFYLWFRLKGIDFIEPKRFLTLLGTGVSDMATAGFFPSWFIGVLLLISFSRAEDTIQKVTGQNISITGTISRARGRGATNTKTNLPPKLQRQATGIKETAGNFRENAKNNALERAEKLREHATEYREKLVGRLKTYGEDARSGKKYIDDAAENYRNEIKEKTDNFGENVRKGVGYIKG